MLSFALHESTKPGLIHVNESVDMEIISRFFFFLQQFLKLHVSNAVDL